MVITEAYAESTKKAAQYDTAKWHEIHIIQCLAKNMDKEPSHPDVQALIKERQDFIMTHFYTCSNEMLREYMNVERDVRKYADGLSAFIAQATYIYCST